MGNICESPSWVIIWEYLWKPKFGNMWEIFVGAWNNLWACISILVSGLMRLEPEKFYLNKLLDQKD